MRLPVSIPLRTPTSLILALGLAHCAALALLWPLELASSLRLALAAAIAFSAWRTLSQLCCPAVRVLHLARDGSLELEMADGKRRVATVKAQTTVLRALVVLLLRQAEGTESIVLPRDAVAAEAHRELRLWLRWRAAAC